jgi:hypothetical protein
MTPGLPPLGPHPSNAFAFAPGLPSFGLPGFFPLDSRASFLWTPGLPSFGLPGFLPLDSRASFLLTPATLQPLALVASPKLGLRHLPFFFSFSRIPGFESCFHSLLGFSRCSWWSLHGHRLHTLSLLLCNTFSILEKLHFLCFMLKATYFF